MRSKNKMPTIVCCGRKNKYRPLHTEISNVMKENTLIKFGERVRVLRKERGLSQEQLAHHADLHRTYIGMIERAEKNITLLNIEKIANALNIHVYKLLQFNE